MSSSNSDLNEPPYSLPSLPKAENEPLKVSRRDRWNATEFVRVEALLRSPIVWGIYRQVTSRHKKPSLLNEPNYKRLLFYVGLNMVTLRGKSDAQKRAVLLENSLRDRFKVEDGWGVIWGSHHRYLPSHSRNLAPTRLDNALRGRFDFANILKAKNNPKLKGSIGIWDLSAFARSKEFASLNRVDSGIIIRDLQQEFERFHYLRIDAAISPKVHLKALQGILEKRYSEIKEGTVRSQRYTEPPVRDIRTWLWHFQAYDLCQAQTGAKKDIKQIAIKLFGIPKSARDETRLRNRTKQGIGRVECLIRKVEAGIWPPNRTSRQFSESSSD